MVEKHIGDGLNILLLPPTTMSNVVFKIYCPPTDHLDRLPDHLLLLIFHRLTGDVKSLHCCAALCRRFLHLVSQIQHLTFRVPSYDIFSLSQTFLNLLTKPLETLTQFLSPKTPNPNPSPSPLSKPLKLFKDICLLKIQLPVAELRIQDVGFLKWKAKYGSSLDNFVVLTASSVYPPLQNILAAIQCCFDAAAARHYSLYPLVSEHPNLSNLYFTDSDNQGMLCMNKEQLDEFRAMPLESAAQPTLTMKLWYEPNLELPDGVVLKEAMLACIRPSGMEKKMKVSEDVWLADAFQEEPYCTAAEMMFKGRAFVFRG